MKAKIVKLLPKAGLEKFEYLELTPKSDFDVFTLGRITAFKGANYNYSFLGGKLVSVQFPISDLCSYLQSGTIK